MATAVFFHAHPDDEAIATGGSMAEAAAGGHRVVLVVATRGELGEPVPGVLADGEDLASRRVAETHRSAAALGVARVEFLGYRDSGMMGEPTNDHPAAFWRADVGEAGECLASVLTEESAELLVVYDSHGSYGHPDHIQVHRVGMAAKARAGTPRVLEVTMNRDQLVEAIAERTHEARGLDAQLDDRRQDLGVDAFGTPEAEITHAIDVRDVLGRKRAAMAAHASQIGEDSFFLAMPPEAFARFFGTEWYIDPSEPRRGGPFRTTLW